MDTDAARSRFPRGLYQPEQGFRFSADALLLSAFAHPGTKGEIIDLGCGCGVVGLGLVLFNLDCDLRLKAVDREPEMIELGRKNARLLGLDRDVILEQIDLGREQKKLPNEAFDLALANPPYHARGSGRVPAQAGIEAGAFEDQDREGLEVFLSAAKRVLKNKARICLVYRSERIQEVLTHMDKHRLRVKRIRFVHGRQNQKSRLVLLEGTKNAAPGGCSLEPPLILYHGTQLTEQAGRFCPFLKCNPERGKDI
ncbi:MAG: tRNA1(Val) (adenine(37)-N6)-methyltransferase [Desulfonatronovibrionaceae bacterium]